ncbi:MAG: M20 family metallopeptidase [Eubacterium sp.]
MAVDYMKNLPDDLKKYEIEVTNLRRDLHKIPESGFKEFKTQHYILSYLKKLGYIPQKICKTGVALYIPGNGDLKETIAIRADMDGLGVVEESDIDFVSEHEGMMHACGHDGHMTMVLLTAHYLKEHPEKLKRNILLIFQPAEEGPGGAGPISESGIFEKYGVKAIFAYHLFPFIEEGIISTTPGPMMAMTTEFYIDFLGKSGHAADPDKGIDAIVAVADYISVLQKIVSRTVSPNESALLSVGTINGGTRMNIIADKVSISGTVRSFSMKIQNEMKNRMIEMAEGIEKMYRCQIKIRFVDMYPPVINNEALFNQIWPLCGEVEDKEIFKKVMLAEDFAMYHAKIPGVFIGLGTKNEEKGMVENLHTHCFNFDEKVLLRGVHVYLKIIEKEELYQV